MTPIIKRNTTLPTTQIYSCTTVVDKQPSLHIKVFEGEREMTKDNHLLGIFEFSGIPSAPRGVPKIEFIFDIDIYSGLHLSAIDKTSGIKKKLTITNDKNYLSKDEIERMIFEAEKFEKDDEMQCECDTVKQSLESYCINTEATINDKKLAHKINTNERKRIMENIEETLEWLETNQVRFYEVHQKFFIDSVVLVC
jgi:L1 cell adhesion molecule like protein